jgi:hypothetical protein
LANPFSIALTIGLDALLSAVMARLVNRPAAGLSGKILVKSNKNSKIKTKGDSYEN